MCSRMWREVYQAICAIDKLLPRPKRRPVYSDVQIVAMFVWAAAHDRPMVWGCDPRNYDRTFRPRTLPSQSRFSRRLRTERCQAILKQLPEQTKHAATPGQLHYLDGRPLPVGPCTKDADATAGRVYGGFSRGYRLHACMRKDGFFAAFEIRPLNVSEKTVASDLLERVRPTGWVLADGNYDSGALYECAAQWGGQLLAPPRVGKNPGHRKANPHRERAIRLWRLLGRWARAERKAIDRFFGQHSSYGGGLAPLPAWVRTLDRVTRWVTVKIALYHARLRIRKNDLSQKLSA